jgi:hypothetical protein
MVFRKSFPSRSDKSVYPKWQDVFLDETEEARVEGAARQENLRIMEECIRDAKKVAAKENLKEFQSDIIHMAIALFEKRSSHSIYWKENFAQEKFLQQDAGEQSEAPQDRSFSPREPGQQPKKSKTFTS